MIFNMTGGGTALNFKVVSNPQPTNPIENTIWIDTDTEITGWEFSAVQPETPSEGMAWILIGTYSPAEFNVLKKNSIRLHPLSAKQYINGTWAEKTTKSYQGGEWVDWIPEGALYYYGDECPNRSGGWQARGWKYKSNYETVVPIIVNHEDHMEITVDSGNIISGAVEIKTDQDFTNISSITIDFEVTLTEFHPYLMVIDRNAAYFEAAVRSVNVVGDGTNNGTFTRRTATLDTSGLSGLYDVVIGFADAWAGAKPTGVSMKVYSVIMN